MGVPKLVLLQLDHSNLLFLVCKQQNITTKRLMLIPTLPWNLSYHLTLLVHTSLLLIHKMVVGTIFVPFYPHG